MRLGSYACQLKQGSLSQKLYGSDVIHERHRHRYEFNCLYEQTLTDKGLQIVGRSLDGKFVEIVELPTHPWYVAVQFHPEFKSKPRKPHPLFAGFVEASYRHKQASPAADAPAEPARGTSTNQRVNIAPVAIGPLALGPPAPLLFIGGPCVIESPSHALDLAARSRRSRGRSGCPTSSRRPSTKPTGPRSALSRARPRRGPAHVRAGEGRAGLPDPDRHPRGGQADAVAAVADVLQIPAFLSRQTDLLVAAARTGKVVNMKKGQFLAPLDMRHPIAKVRESGNDRVFVTERGFTFGYHNLVVDMRAFPMIRSLGVPVVFDVTHSLQLPGAGNGVTAGQAEFIEPLASAGVAAGVDGVFMEVHEDPSRARSDGQNALQLDRLEAILTRLVALDRIARPIQPVPVGA